jgi:hypothetical protein
MKPVRLIALLTLPAAFIALVVLMFHLGLHDSCNFPDPATNHIVGVHTKRGGICYQTPWEHTFNTWMPIGVAVFILGWTGMMRMLRPAKPGSDP